MWKYIILLFIPLFTFGRKPMPISKMQGDWSIVGIPKTIKSTKPVIQFNGDIHGFEIRGKCNLVAGTYKEGNSTIQFQNITTTLDEGCKTPPTKTISCIQNQLRKANKYKLDGDNLYFYQNKKLLLKMKKIVKKESENKTAKVPIEGDYRVLAQKENGEDVERLMNKSSIKLFQNKLSANVGCNQIGGEFTSSSEHNSISTNGVFSTEMFCGDELSVFENALIKNLNEIKTYKLEANHLYFYDTSNRLILFLERQQTEE